MTKQVDQMKLEKKSGFRDNVLGYYFLPQLASHWLQPGLHSFGLTSLDFMFKVTPVAELEKIVRDLRFRESRRVVIQGFILAVKFVPCEDGVAAQSTGTSPQKDSRVYTLR